MLEERYGKFTILKLKLSRLSYTAVEYSNFYMYVYICVTDRFENMDRFKAVSLL